MNTHEHIATLNRRLQQVEADHARLRRRSRWLQVGCITGIGALILIAASDVTRVDTLRAHRLEIIDADGHIVLAASGRESGGQLDLWSPSGDNLVRVGANQSGGDVAVWNTNGINVAGVWATAAGGEVGAWNTEGVRAASLTATKNGGRLALSTTENASHIELAAGTAPVLRMLDGNGIERSRFEPGLAILRGDDDITRLTLSSQLDAPILRLTGSGNSEIAASFSGGAAHMHIQSSDSSANFTGSAVSLSHANTTTTLQASETGGQWQCGTGLLQLAEGDLKLLNHGNTLMQTTASDGEVSLHLTAPGSSATLLAGAAATLNLHGSDASIQLAGKATEAVTLASGAEMPVLHTTDDAVSVFASNGAGRIMLGSGEAGQVRLTGGTDGMRPAVDILAADRTRIATLSSTKSGLGMLAVTDSSGTPVGLLHAAASGRGRLAIHGQGGTAIATAAADGTPEFALLGTDGRTTAALAATPRGGALNLMNSDGTPVVLAGITADGPGGAAAFQNGSGVTVVAAGSTKDNTGRVVVTE